MSKNFTGVTFAKQKVTPSYDAIVRRALLTDGTLTGCDISYSGSTLTMAAGQLMICGRQIVHPASQNWSVTGQTSGFARLILTIDLTRTSTKDTFDQVVDSIQYASDADGFETLEQTDINTTGTKYQVDVCVVSLGPGGITGIVSQLDRSEGGGAGLNFKVVGGTTAPVTPTKNIIWLNTPTRIPTWTCAPTEPMEPAEGLVWLVTGTTSKISFSATKKNDIQVSLIAARQFVDGTWINVEAKIYQDGTWKDVAGTYIYRDGISFFSESAYALNGSTVTFGSAEISTKTNAGKISEAYAVFGPILMDSIDTLQMTAAFTDRYGGTHNHVLFVSKSPSAGYKKAAAIAEKNASTSKETYVLELSVANLSGEYYVYAGQHTSGSAWESQRTQAITEVREVWQAATLDALPNGDEVAYG